MGDITGKKLFVEFVAGTWGGVYQAVAGHPFDTIKTRLQADGSFKSPFQCFSQTVSDEGIRGLYKGLSAPLVLTGFQNAWLFTVNSIAKNVVGKGRDPLDLSLAEIIAAAELTAPFYCLAVTPIEIVKNKLQHQRHLSHPL